MKKLIISSNTYSFLPYCAGMLMTDNSDNSLYIINKDYRKMMMCKYLCKEAVFIQRQYDIVNISKHLNISDINFYSSSSEEGLKVQIQLAIALKGVTEVYHPDWGMLNTIISNVAKKLDIKQYKYKPITNCIEAKRYILDKHIYEKKLMIANDMVGINSKKEIKQLYKPIEYFFI